MRAVTTTHKIVTEFGNCYVHVDHLPDGRPIGGAISTPGKHPTSKINTLLETISDTLNAALNDVGQVR